MPIARMASYRESSKSVTCRCYTHTACITLQKNRIADEWLCFQCLVGSCAGCSAIGTDFVISIDLSRL